MRQVKFRALELDSPSGINWVYGYYVAINGYYMTDGVPDLNQPVVRHYIFSDDGIKYEIAESTVGQFIGLADKNDIEIYEGDIVQLHTEWSEGYDGDEYGETLSIGVVSLNPSKGAVISRVKVQDLLACDDLWKKHPHSLNVRGYRSEIIGNIQENPELLCAKK